MKDALEKFSQLSERKQGALFRSLELKRFLSIKSCFLYLKMKYLSSYELLATLECGIETKTTGDFSDVGERTTNTACVDHYFSQ